MTDRGAPESAPENRYSYRFLLDGMRYQNYYGWLIADTWPGLCVLVKRHAVLTRYLCLLTNAGRDRIAGAIPRTGLPAVTEIVIHDFDQVFAEPPEIAGRRFRAALPVADPAALLPPNTMVVDLSKDDDALLAAMSTSKSNRKRLKQRAGSGVTVEVHERPDETLCRIFFDALADFYASKNLAVPDRGILRRMYERGDALLFVARKDGQIVNFQHIYRAGDTGVAMHFVALQRSNDGAGLLTDWETMRDLKARGIRWYDLGGGAERTDETDSLFLYKQRLGAVVVPLCAEWVYTGSAVGAARDLAAFKRRLVSKAAGRTAAGPA